MHFEASWQVILALALPVGRKVVTIVVAAEF